jgi:hypothetical protein
MTPMKKTLQFGTALAAAATLVLTAACNDVLDTEPYDRISATSEIVDAATAQAALNGAYDALQSNGMYGLYVEAASALASHEAEWAGTFQYLGDMSVNHITADNAAVSSMWNAHYLQIDRDNTILLRVPDVADIDEDTRDGILGEAHFLRALSYSNLVKYWGPVPLPLVPVTKPSDATQYTRATVADVYTQILSDLDQAASLIKNTTDTRRATVAAVQALRARVLLYRASTDGADATADYQASLDAANDFLAGNDALTTPYQTLFSPTGENTAEDIFRVSFTTAESNTIGYYYLAAGRFEAAATQSMYAAYEPNDLRRATMALRPNSTDEYQTMKFPTIAGTEHPHVIRRAEVVLIKAEDLARLGQLAAAVDEYNNVRARAGLPNHVLGVDVTTQAEVIAAIDHEREVELAFEGDRFPNLVRQGNAVAVLGIADRAFQTLFPIPIGEITTSPNLTQNPGY